MFTASSLAAQATQLEEKTYTSTLGWLFIIFSNLILLIFAVVIGFPGAIISSVTTVILIGSLSPFLWIVKSIDVPISISNLASSFEITPFLSRPKMSSPLISIIWSPPLIPAKSAGPSGQISSMLPGSHPNLAHMPTQAIESTISREDCISVTISREDCISVLDSGVGSSLGVAVGSGTGVVVGLGFSSSNNFWATLASTVASISTSEFGATSLAHPIISPTSNMNKIFFIGLILHKINFVSPSLQTYTYLEIEMEPNLQA